MRWLLCICMCWMCGELAAQARIESEYKISVPKENMDSLWQFLQTTFVNNAAGILPSGSTTQTATEIFYDTYFDDVEETLLGYQAGARYRERYVGDSLMKRLLQLKVPTLDKLGIARTEHKFSPEDKFDINDRSGLHPFLKHVKAKDLDDVDLVLGQFGTAARKMNDALKLKQVRRRVYIADKQGALMTFTLDEVSAIYFPYSSFVELELELNEVRYTYANAAEKLNLESMNAKVKQVIFERFGTLQQDQTPKYNKMHATLAAQPSSWVYNNLMYILLGGISFFAMTIMIRKEPRFANT